MLTFVIILSYVFINFLVNGSVTESNSENNQNEWSYGISNIPGFGWVHDKIYPSFNSDARKFPNQGETAILDYDLSAETPESLQNVDDILEIIENSTDEEKKRYESFLTNLENTISNNPIRYVKVFLKNIWYTVDLGVFNSGERRRDAEKTRNLLQIIRDLLYEIFSAIYNFFADRIEAGKRGAQKGWAEYEREQEKDERTWTEEEALKKLENMEKHIETIDKETMIKDITSLCMQPLYKTSTYEKIIIFLDTLRENHFDRAKLDKAFQYVNYKGKFSKDHNIN